MKKPLRRQFHAAGLATRHADSLRLKNYLGKATTEYRRAIALDDTSFDAWYGLGLATFGLGAYGEAARSFGRALELAASPFAVHLELGRALFYLGEIDTALEHFRQAVESPDSELRSKALATIACIVPGSARSSNSSVLHDRRAWAQVEEARVGHSKRAGRRPTRRGRKLRLGYCSKFFHEKNWMKPVWGVINHHDRSKFEIHLFSDGMPPNAESGYQRNPLDHLHDVRDLSNADLASMITRIGIDVLIDLNGYSFRQRFGVFIMRPAPINVAWFNMYATSGIEAFDYIIGDAAVIPPSEEKFYCERVLRVPGSYLAFSVLYPVPEVTPPPCLTAGHITFGSLCSQYKITDQVVAAWARILQQTKDARLFIKNAGLDDSTNCIRTYERFARCGIVPERLRLEGSAPHEEFLAAYEKVDIALDPFPYNGGTTTMEALWQGVPVLTFNGDRWASRQSRSLLLAAGLDEWCMANLEAYIARAVALAQLPGSPAELSTLRSTLRERLARMPVCDTAGLCHSLELIYHEVSA